MARSHFLPGHTGDGDDQFVESQLVNGGSRYRNVSRVRRVERPPEYPDSASCIHLVTIRQSRGEEIADPEWGISTDSRWLLTGPSNYFSWGLKTQG